MDKPNKPQTILLKVGGKKKAKREEQKLIVQDWRRGGEESAAAAEPQKEEEDFQWVLASEEEKDEALTLKAPLAKQHGRKRVVSRLLLTIIGAVLIGLLLGYGMIKIITNKEEVPPKAALKEPAGQKPDVPAPPAASKQQASSLPVIESAIVQGGVFSTKEGAEAEKEKARNRGIPADIVSRQGQFVLLLGVAEQMETAKFVGAAYKAEGANVFAKTETFAAADTIPNEADPLIDVFSLIAEESAKQLAGHSVDQSRLKEAKQQLEKAATGKKESAHLKKLLSDALIQAKSDQPQAAKAAQEKLLAFLAVYQGK
ncbi:hypothetical protein [Bacillus xiapuensis]|uniref:hypothetical protein n=1 Tax=Bacillus xiapuensis TaxID=2014075 RepID=UPI0012FDF0AC|nr:hypothetical protein [Bacillus xiapuensis]